MLHLAWTLREIRPGRSLINLKTGWTRQRKKTCLRRMSQPRSPMTGDNQNPASVPDFLRSQVYRVIVLREQARSHTDLMNTGNPLWERACSR
jgi:hypothetical protein